MDQKIQAKDLGGGKYQLPPELGEPNVVEGQEELTRRVKAYFDAQPKVKPDKVAIIGYAPSRDLVPWNDPMFERWGLNDLYAVPGMGGAGPDGKGLGYQLWFQLHSRTELVRMRRPEHLQWLEKQENVPAVMMQEHYPTIPRSVRFPLEDLIGRWREYLTNSISYMIGYALVKNTIPAPPELQKYGLEYVRDPEGIREIHLYGIDMAAGEEFEYQRSSVEYYIGLAEALGFRTYIPPTSDILKTPRRYGYEGAFTILDKMRQRDEEQQQNMMQLQNGIQQQRDQLNQVIGMKNERDYLKRNWIFDTARSQEWASTEGTPKEG